jgi:uncharacterized protein YraI/lysophospholipase L1-like esterase
MQRWILLGFLLLLGLPASAQTANAQIETGWTNINLRTEPSANASVLAELSGGIPLIVLSRTADYIWYQAQTMEGLSGWIASRYVTLLVPQNTIPVYQAPSNAPAPVAPLTNDGSTNGQITAGTLNLRATPSLNGDVLAELPRGTRVLIVGRSADNIWLQIQASGLSGWVAGRYVQADVALSTIPVVGAEAVVSAPTNTSGTPFFTLGGAAGSIFARGQALGNRANVFSKVGDSMTVEDEMFRPIGYGAYNLGGYSYLQSTIDFFRAGQARTDNPFNNVSLAANGGWTSATLLDTNFANTSVCSAGETPLACEYRLNKPAVALIMIGSNDLVNTPVEQYAYNLRLIANISIEAGVIPVFSTIPSRYGFEARAVDYNQRIIGVAQELGLPLWDYYSVMMTLPNSGLSGDGLHPSTPPSRFADAANFTGDFLQYGYVQRNLTMLQVLDVLRVNILQ